MSCVAAHRAPFRRAPQSASTPETHRRSANPSPVHRQSSWLVLPAIVVSRTCHTSLLSCLMVLPRQNPPRSNKIVGMAHSWDSSSEQPDTTITTTIPHTIGINCAVISSAIVVTSCPTHLARVVPQLAFAPFNHSGLLPQCRRCGTANSVLRFINASLIWRDGDTATRG